MRWLCDSEIEDVLVKLGVTEAQMDAYWSECHDICVVVRAMAQKGQTWRDLPETQMIELTTYKAAYELYKNGGERLLKEIYLEGNNGGDYIRLKQYAKQEKNSTVYLEVGCSCVVTASHEIPVEFLTVLISNAVLEANCDVAQAVQNVLGNYDKEYQKERSSKVKKW